MHQRRRGVSLDLFWCEKSVAAKGIHLQFLHVLALQEQGRHGFGRGIKQQEPKWGAFTLFTRFAFNAFTSVAYRTSNRHICLVTDPNSMIRNSLERLGCLVSGEVVS